MVPFVQEIDKRHMYWMKLNKARLCDFHSLFRKRLVTQEGVRSFMEVCQYLLSNEKVT